MQRQPAHANFLPAAAADTQTLLRAREEALQGRDMRKNGHGLVEIWRDASKPKKQGAIPAQPPGCKVDFERLFSKWLQDRGLVNLLKRKPDHQGWAVYGYETDRPVVHSGPGWEQAFHGTWWYSVWLILKSGILLESSDRSLGHDFWEPGVYCSPSLDTGLWYARPQILFGDGVYYRIIFELRVDPGRRKKNRKRGGVQWVFPCAGVALHAIWVRSNAPPANGEERLNTWEPSLEALPAGCEPCEAIQNPRIGPWPHIPDEFPFILADTSVPPWMQSKKVCEVDLRPVCGATTANSCNWNNTQGQSPSAGEHDYWSAWPGVQSGLGWTEDAPEVWATEWTSESGTNAGLRQLPPRGSVVVLQQQRVEQEQNEEQTEDHWEEVEVRSQEEEDAAATAEMLQLWSSLCQDGSSTETSVSVSGGRPVVKRDLSGAAAALMTLFHTPAVAEKTSPVSVSGESGAVSVSKRPLSEAGGMQCIGPAFKRPLVKGGPV